MDNKCNFCGEDKGTRPLYCSSDCIKRAWRSKRFPNYYYNNKGNNQTFWESETGIGMKWEIYIADLIGGEHLMFNHKDKKTQRADILWDGKLIDVKSAHLNKRKNKRGKAVVGAQKGYWVFKGGKPKDIDYIFCVCIGQDEKVEKVLMIPFNEYNYSIGISVGWKSAYDKFIYKNSLISKSD